MKDFYVESNLELVIKKKKNKQQFNQYHAWFARIKHHKPSLTLVQWLIVLFGFRAIYNKSWSGSSYSKLTLD